MDEIPSVLTSLEEAESENQEIKDKKKKKKKKSAAFLKKLQAKAAEEARHKLMLQKQESLRLIKLRVQAEWEANHIKGETYITEFKERERALQESCQKLQQIEDIWEEYKQERRKEKEWQEYLSCSGLPSSWSMPQMNSYLYVWTELDQNYQMSHCIKKTQELMELLNGLEEVIRDPGPNVRPYSIHDMKELRNEMRNLLQERMDKASFYLFSRIDTDMVPVNVSTTKYFAKSPYFRMSLWAELYMPIHSFKGREVRNPLIVTFDEIDLTISIPVKLLDIQKVIRAMWLNYDHWSDKCRSYDCPTLPFYYFQTLHDLFITEFDTKRDIIEYRDLVEKATKKRIASLPPEPTLSQEILAWYSTPQRALSDEVMFKECEQEDIMGRQVKEALNEFEVNLRERTFLGEFLLLEILHQPPQAQCFRLKHCVTLREEQPKLKLVDFYEVFKAPDITEIEEELRKKEETKKETKKDTKPDSKQDSKKEEQKRQPEEILEERIEEEKKKLVSVQLQLSQAVLWFEKPELAIWHSTHGYWSTEDIYDLNVDEEEGVMSFKTGRLGLMGLHVSTYCHFPYDDWCFETNEDGGVSFYLKTPKADLHFIIRECEVCLESLEGGRSKAMSWILGKYYPPFELMRHLKQGGIDVFPAPDATAYVNEVRSKHIILEQNIYQIWGLFSKTFRFKRSKFNQVAERGKLVFQAQEIHKTNQVDFCLVLTSMCSCYVLNINEDSEDYSTEIAPGMELCVDFHTLLLKNSTTHARRQAMATSVLEIQTVKEFLTSIRPISFS